MEWTGHGLTIGARKHGERDVILEVMVKDRGRHLGLVRGGRSPRMAATLQPGNDVQLTWRARLDEHLGNYTVELVNARAAELIADKSRLYACQLVCDHLRLLPERDPHNKLLGLSIDVLECPIDSPLFGVLLAKLEFTLLDELGFGLDIYACAVSGATEGLEFVSPKTGRAVTREAAGEFADRLLPLPSFLRDEEGVGTNDLANAFKLTGFFLDRHVWSARQISQPGTREALVEILTRKV